MASDSSAGIVFASFGTTHDQTRARCIDAVAADLQAAFPAHPVAQAYTSSIVRRALGRRGVEAADVRGALVRLAAQGVRNVVVQPGHLMPGHEYDKLCREAAACRGVFDHLRVGEPLLAGTADLHRLLDIVAAEFPRQSGQAVVLMGHGTDHFANVVYEAMDFAAQLIGRDDILIGTVEAQPGLPALLRLMRERGGIERVVLAPLMLVAGDHATNDMAGADPRSWTSQLGAAGYEVHCVMRGLGELPLVRRMYVEKARAAAGGRDIEAPAPAQDAVR